VVYCKVLVQHPLGDTEENNENHQEDQKSYFRIELVYLFVYYVTTLSLVQTIKCRLIE
jgi:hypothetical protein